jgi:hypothetical protein
VREGREEEDGDGDDDDDDDDGADNGFVSMHDVMTAMIMMMMMLADPWQRRASPGRRWCRD